MTKLDLKKELNHLYNPTHKEVVEVVVPPLQFVMIDGAGNPDHSPNFQAAMETLYGLSYTLKFASKGEQGIDYIVMPVEGLWWMADQSPVDLDPKADRSGWRWTLMMMQPDHITHKMFDAAVASVRKKKNPPNLDAARFETYDEGLAAQIMHIGPYSTEKLNVDRVHAFIHDQGCQPHAKHHEIYIGDPNKSAPEKLKTVLRQPMQRLCK